MLVRLTAAKALLSKTIGGGGLGGGVSGWRITLPLAFLLGAVFFAGAAALAIKANSPSTDSSQCKATNSDQTSGTANTGVQEPETE